MKYLVLSDSHGNVDNMARAVEREKPDGIIHLGDCWRDAEELHELFPRLPLEQVPGNCDLGRFEDADERMNLSPLGSGALAGTLRRRCDHAGQGGLCRARQRGLPRLGR